MRSNFGFCGKPMVVKKFHWHILKKITNISNEVFSKSMAYGCKNMSLTSSLKELFFYVEIRLDEMLVGSFLQSMENTQEDNQNMSFV